MSEGAIAQSSEALEADRKTLRSVSLLFRHSVISPKYSPPKLKTDWPMGYRQLTAIGVTKTYANGQELRKLYVDQLGLISPRYNLKEVYFRASNADRALQTAQVLALGLYPLGTGPDPAVYDNSLKAVPRPDLAFTPVPIHAVSLRNDAVLRPWTGQANCQRYRQFVKALPKSKLYKAQAKRFEPFLRRIASITGINEGKSPARILYGINEIYEPLTAFIAHKKPLSSEITEKDMELLRLLSDWNYHHQFLGKKMGRLTGGPMVGEVLGNFLKYAKDPKTARKLYIYSGHQRTVLGLEAALGIETARTEGPLFKGRVPPLGSRYAFELHETAPKAYSVRLKFVSKEAEKTIEIPGCGGGFCPLERFRKVVADAIPANWRAECQIKKKEGWFGRF
ncbi:MAG: histidine phosphatase family protein [Alphaproteobacteria bacterium]|nr:histidine phosphatase family protein [Alphaproteobacteria bacterium]